MFCPKCGQSQASEMMRYCSRCGFQLTAISDLMFTDGVGLGEPRRVPTTFELIRRRIGAKIIFFSLVLTPFLLLASIGVDNPFPLIIGLAIFVIGLADILYAQLFGGGLGSLSPNKPAVLPPTEVREGLPPSPGEPIPWRPAKGTAEMVQPPSVTEPTTKLFELDTDPHAE